MRLMPWIDSRTKAVRDVPVGSSVLDIGTNDGSTLMHFAEYRPDIRFFAVDIAGQPRQLPPGCNFVQMDAARDDLPFDTASLDAVMALHLIEHLTDWTHLFVEIKRVLKPGGSLYLEFPAAKTLHLPSPEDEMKGRFTFNFHDDSTHVRLPDIEELRKMLTGKGFTALQTGTSRNLLFAAAYALYYQFRPASFHRYTAYAHWIGWSSYLYARVPGKPVEV